MLIDDLREKLKFIEPDIQLIHTYWENAHNEERYNELHAHVHTENFWQHKNQIALSKEYQNLKELREEYKALTFSYKEQLELLDLFEDDEHELKTLVSDIDNLCKKVKTFKISLLLNKEKDHSNCFLSINAGAGGTESQDWASMLMRMFLRFCEQENLPVEIIDYQSGEEAGIKSTTLYVKGKNPYGILKSESGIHRLVRISPFDTSKRRHTSFAAVTVTPEVEDEKIEVKDDELRHRISRARYEKILTFAWASLVDRLERVLKELVKLN